MARFPLEVEIDENNLLRLQRVFKRAQKQIASEIEGATDFGVANRKDILSQIDVILKELGKEVADKVIVEAIVKQYETGAKQAVGQLTKVGAGVPVKTGFNRVHKDAIKMLVDDTGRSFAEALTGVKRNATTLLNKAVKEQITQKMATGKIGGETLKKIKREVVGIMREQGIAALIDRGGRKWELDRYAEMLIRTKAVEARNRGLANRMVENDYDLVQVSDHNSSHEACRVWEGKILSVRGLTRGYPTLAQAEAAGLFHPNCKHAINVLVPELAKRTRAYDPDTKTVIIKQKIKKVEE